MKKITLFVAVLVLGTQINVFAGEPNQPQKLNNPHHAKKASANYEMSKELRKTKKVNKSNSSEVNSTNIINAKKTANFTQVSA